MIFISLLEDIHKILLNVLKFLGLSDRLISVQNHTYVTDLKNNLVLHDLPWKMSRQKVNGHWWWFVVGNRRLISECTLFALCQGATIHSLINQRHLKPQLYSLSIYFHLISISFTCPQKERRETSHFTNKLLTVKEGMMGTHMMAITRPATQTLRHLDDKISTTTKEMRDS